MPIRHRAGHRTEHVGWLRAAVLGANDGILPTASLVLGVAAAGSLHRFRSPARAKGEPSAVPEAFISRDRGGGYGHAATTAAPQAVQVADRRHLMRRTACLVLVARE